MKRTDILILSFKNFSKNLPRFILTLISLVMLSSIIILICNFCFYFKKTTDAQILHSINTNGIHISYTIKKDKHNNPMMDKIEPEDISNFINRAEMLKIMQEFSLEYDNVDCVIPLVPTIGGYSGDILSGETSSYEDKGKDFIWLSQEYAETNNLGLGDTVAITLNGINNQFVVKGIIDSYNSAIDYSYFDITKITVSANDVKYDDYAIIKSISRFIKTATKNTTITEISITYNYFYFVLGLCIFLTLFCIAFSLGNVLNLLKINIEENYYSIAIMRSLGMKKNSVLLYIFTQMFALVTLSTIISTLITWIFSKLTLNSQLVMVSKMFGNDKSVIKSGFNFLLPLFNLLLLAVSLFFSSLKMLQNHNVRNVIDIMREVE